MKNVALGDLVMVKYLVFRGTQRPYVPRESIKCLHVQLRLAEVLAGPWRPYSAASLVVETSYLFCFLLVLQHRTSLWCGGNIVMDGGGHDRLSLHWLYFL